MAATPTWATDGELKPAPGPLLLVQSFVNTAEFDAGTDVLADAATANLWLRDAGLQGSAVSATAEELRLARAVREDIRALLLANAGGPRPAAGSLHALQTAASDEGLTLVVSPDGRIDLTAGQPHRQAAGLLMLLVVIRDAQRDGTWARLKACGNEDCRWVFYARSHSGRGAWCDMATCGNMIKNRNLRARRGSQPRAAPRPARPVSGQAAAG